MKTLLWLLPLTPAALLAAQPALLIHQYSAQYCAGCHNDKLKSGGLSLTALDATDVKRDAREWGEGGS